MNKIKPPLTPRSVGYASSCMAESLLFIAGISCLWFAIGWFAGMAWVAWTN